MARRTRRKTRSFKVPKKGGRRKTARRAFMPAARRRRRSNPVAFYATPAFKSAAYAVGGAVAFSAVDQAGLLKKTVPNALTRSLIFAGATIALASMAKGKTKGNLIALGVGMVALPAVSEINSRLKLGSVFGGQAQIAAAQSMKTKSIQRRMAASSSPYSVAMSHSNSVASGGLKNF